MRLNTKFNIMQRVLIKELDVPATVSAILYFGLAVIYEVEYWWEGEIKKVQLYEYELTAGRG